MLTEKHDTNYLKGEELIPFTAKSDAKKILGSVNNTSSEVSYDQEKHWKNYIDGSVIDIGTARIADLNIYDKNFNLVDEIYIMIENWITPIKAETLAFLMVLNVSSYMLKNKLYI
ncbi:hypothetical protein RhiirA1_466491 [Rhizophagus irregularis]|uniref:Uncharacterized protein n=1 Tax=Rhizophagus irregularis TaxID=588596 RepID=A0A2N0RDU6_9GLOM|nr:hypothetical protein RhiirA1_466491 [Rhizophagus irregularis]GET61352.1 hypothetical protein GLOIN_2v1479662 [Rhizophagus irregularis DAOM 181602=DAOM 197198]